MLKKITEKIIKDTVQEEFNKSLVQIINEEISENLKELLKVDLKPLIKKAAEDFVKDNTLKSKVTEIFKEKAEGLLNEAFEDFDCSDTIYKILNQNSEALIKEALKSPNVNKKLINRISEEITDEDTMEEFLDQGEIEDMLYDKMKEVFKKSIKIPS